MTDNLAYEIKQLIIETLFLEDIGPEDISDSAPLFGDGLGLDSIDALELGLALKKRYNLVLDADAEETRQYFRSIDSLKHLIQSSADKAG